MRSVSFFILMMSLVVTYFLVPPAVYIYMFPDLSESNILMLFSMINIGVTLILVSVVVRVILWAQSR